MVEPIDIDEEGVKSVRIDESGDLVEVTEAAADLIGFDSETLTGQNIHNLLTENANGVKCGRMLQQALDGEATSYNTEIIGGEGNVHRLDVNFFPDHLPDVPRSVLMCFSVTDRPDSAHKDEGLDSNDLEEISDHELSERAKNIRIAGPEGPMTLQEVVMDLTVGHNDLENYKNGALFLHDALDERLQEEEQRDSDSINCEIIRELKRDVFGLYLRVQRGDQELFGERSGRYSGYFNAETGNVEQQNRHT